MEHLDLHRTAGFVLHVVPEQLHGDDCPVLRVRRSGVGQLQGKILGGGGSRQGHYQDKGAQHFHHFFHLLSPTFLLNLGKFALAL
ncbi:hypothetical protein SDC9_188960 [bioreactor metagenome]|uniref:Uncharacterized protein n=1 Tax=bioreactor metagenome TaxID=1076179 RepID=A0A645HZ30_9ZZZZ